MSAYLSSGTLQTIIIIAGPLLLPRMIRAGRSFFSPGKQHPALPPPRREPDSVRLALLRLLVASIGVCFCLILAVQPPKNVFLPPPSSLPEALLPLLRTPLPLHTPATSLSTNFAHSLRRPLTAADQQMILASCSSLEARKLYLAFGAGPLVGCSWCRTEGHGARVDMLAWVATEVAIGYLVLGGMVCALLSGERGRWRKWAVGAMVCAFGAEMWWRLTWEGPQSSNFKLLHTTLHVARHAFFALLLLGSYFIRPRLVSQTLSAATLLQQPLVNLGNQAESVLHRIRVTSLQRMATLHHGQFRSKVSEFWSNAERESSLARADGEVAAAIEARVKADESASFREWINSALAVPTARPRQPESVQSSI